MPCSGRSAVALFAAALLASCASTHPSSTGDALLDVQNDDLPMSSRVRAIDEAWSKADAGEYDRMLTRQALAEQVVWNRDAHPQLRRTAVRSLLADRTPEGAADSVELAAALLPTEPDRDVIEQFSVAAAARGWTQLSPALVRTLAVFVPREEDRERPEATALRALHPGRPLEAIVFDIFIDPRPAEGLAPERAERQARLTRSAAWDLLARLDPDGSIRAAYLRERIARDPDDPALSALADASRDFAITPITGDELRWLMTLHDGSNRANTEWWRSCAQIIAGLDPAQRERLRLRHLEPVRWTSVHEPSRLSMSREELLMELAARLEGRPVHQRTADDGPFGRRRSERLADNAADLSWGDLLTILAVDDALGPPDVRSALFGQADADRADETTEYGGAMEIVPRVSSDAYTPVPYLPRPMHREHDRKFVPPIELLERTERALAHYHFHVQRPNNGAFAGPGEGDLITAARTGRTSLVLTSISVDELNVDYYQPDGARVDLGVLTRPGASAQR